MTMMKNSLHIIYWVAFIPAFFLLLGFVQKESSAYQCQDFVVEMYYPGEDYLLTGEEVRHMVLQKFDTLTGKPLSSLPVSAIEQAIAHNPFVENAEVYVTINGICVAKVYQRQAVIRLVDELGRSMYLDKHGVIMPDEASSPPRVLVGNGGFSLESAMKDTVITVVRELEMPPIKDMYRIAMAVAQDKDLRNMVEQVYLNQEGEYELITKMGRHSVLLGDARHLEEKLFRLKVFYENAIPRGGWKKYRQINLKFNNQVVCKY